jgi:hypothetical protein
VDTYKHAFAKLAAFGWKLNLQSAHRGGRSLKERAPFIRNAEWKRRVTAFVSRAESVFRHRNIACHMPAVFENGKWTLTPVSAARLLKHLDLEQPRAKRFSFDDLKSAIATGEKALAEGVGLVENFKPLNAELAKKRAAQKR